VAFLGYFFVFPLARILGMSLSGSGFSAVVSRSRLWGVAWFTLWQALASTALTIVAALPLTWAFSRFNFWGKNLLRSLVTVPFVLPTVVVGAAFLAIFERGLLPLLLAHVFFNMAVIVRTVGGVWSRFDRQIEEAAAVLGARPRTVFRRITLPLLTPAVASAAAIVFLFCFTSFGTVLVLGGGSLRTLEVEIYQQTVNFLDLPVAGALSVIQLLMVSAMLMVSSALQKRVAAVTLSGEAQLPPPQGWQRGLVTAVVVATIGVLAVPLIALITASFRAGGAGWAALLAGGQPLTAIGNSLAYSLAATLLAVAVGGAAAAWLSRRSTGSALDLLLMLPLGTSAVTIGFGLLVALDWPIDLRGTIYLVPIAHALVALPFVVRTTLPLLRSIKAELREAAAVLGASPQRVFREIDLPIVSRALAVGAGFAALISLGEFGATSFVVRPASLTVPSLIFRTLARPGAVSHATAMALAVVLAGLTGLIVIAIDRLRGGQSEVF
jgi:thiamine transport system permease protein